MHHRIHASDGFIGGLLIGLSAVVLMGGIGRIAGLSAIFGGLLTLHGRRNRDGGRCSSSAFSSAQR